MKRLSHPATIIAAAALFMALGGGAYAAAQTLISGSKIKNHSIPVNKLTSSAITALKGQKGDPGPSNGYSVLNSNLVYLNVAGETVATLPVGAGSYIVMAESNIADPSHPANTGCYLMAPNNTQIDGGFVSTSTTGGYPEQAEASEMGPLTTTGGNIIEKCYSSDDTASGFAGPSRIVAIKVGSLTGNAGHFHGAGKTSASR